MLCSNAFDVCLQHALVLGTQKAEAWRRCALFSLIPQSGWLTFVVGCDSTVSPADIRSGQGVCFGFWKT